jgi:hypothetical protein
MTFLAIECLDIVNFQSFAFAEQEFKRAVLTAGCGGIHR